MKLIELRDQNCKPMYFVYWLDDRTPMFTLTAAGAIGFDDDAVDAEIAKIRAVRPKAYLHAVEGKC